VQPSNSVFDIVVVQSSEMEAFPESTAKLTGRPIYTVYVPVGTRKEWVLQYCIPRSSEPLMQQGNVVRLGNPAPVKPPYPLVTFRPSGMVQQGSSYILIHGFVDAGGRFKDLDVLRSANSQTSQMVLSCLALWEFRPATRDGVPVLVEILLAIPPDIAG
jgi:hypothetical protein